MRYEHLPPNVVQRAKDCITDTVAVIVQGGALPWSRIVASYAQRTGAGGHCVLDQHQFVDWCGVLSAAGASQPYAAPRRTGSADIGQIAGDPSRLINAWPRYGWINDIGDCGTGHHKRDVLDRGVPSEV